MCEACGTSGSARGPSVLGAVIPAFCLCLRGLATARSGLPTQGRRRPPERALRPRLASGLLPASGDPSDARPGLQGSLLTVGSLTRCWQGMRFPVARRAARRKSAAGSPLPNRNGATDSF